MELKLGMAVLYIYIKGQSQAVNAFHDCGMQVRVQFPDGTKRCCFIFVLELNELFQTMQDNSH